MFSYSKIRSGEEKEMINIPSYPSGPDIGWRVPLLMNINRKDPQSSGERYAYCESRALMIDRVTLHRPDTYVYSWSSGCR